MIPKMIAVAQMIMHHPKSPAVIDLSQITELVPDLLVVRFGLCLVVIHRWLNVEQLKGLPQTNAELLSAVVYQLPLFSRPYSFFSITSLRTVI
jgi:hypothetical protein